MADRFAGRADDQLKIGGIGGANEIIAVLAGILRCSPNMVVPREDKTGSNIWWLTSYDPEYELQPPRRCGSSAHIPAEYMVPAYSALEKLPLSPHGKSRSPGFAITDAETPAR